MCHYGQHHIRAGRLILLWLMGIFKKKNARVPPKRKNPTEALRIALSRV